MKHSKQNQRGKLAKQKRTNTALRLIFPLLLIMALTACGSQQKQTQGLSQTSSTQSQAATRPGGENDFANGRAINNTAKQGKPLWIWIAPRYRSDMPEGTGEYLIETL